MTGAALTVDFNTGIVSREGLQVRVVPRVAEVIHVLAGAYPNFIVAERLGAQLAGWSEPLHDSAIRVHVSNARKPLGRLYAAIENRRGYGWALRLAAIPEGTAEARELMEKLAVGAALDHEPSVAEIVRAVAMREGISTNELLAHGRQLPIVLPRQEVMFLAMVHTSCSLPTIGKALRRDHTTVAHGAMAHAARNGLRPPRGIGAKRYGFDLASAGEMA